MERGREEREREGRERGMRRLVLISIAECTST